MPIVIVATKKDDFLDIEFGAHRKTLKKEGKKFDVEACEKHAEERLHERIETIRSEMESVPGGRLDACLAVSQGECNLPSCEENAEISRLVLHSPQSQQRCLQFVDDDDSISNLSKITSQCFDIDKVRL